MSLDLKNSKGCCKINITQVSTCTKFHEYINIIAIIYPIWKCAFIYGGLFLIHKGAPKFSLYDTFSIRRYDKIALRTKVIATLDNAFFLKFRLTIDDLIKDICWRFIKIFIRLICINNWTLISLMFWYFNFFRIIFLLIFLLFVHLLLYWTSITLIFFLLSLIL